MDTSQSVPNFDESVAQVLQTLPPVVRAYLAQGKYTPVAQNLMAKYGLRVDQGGVLEREIMLLLMGVENPEEFARALVTDARLEQKTVDSIVQEVNAQIFIPLREEEKKSGVAGSPAGAVLPQQVAGAPIPQLVVPTAPSAAPQKFMHLDNRIPPPARPTAAPVTPAPHPLNQAPAAPVAGKGASLRDVLSTVTKVPPRINQLSSAPRKMLEDHEEPHIDFHTAPANLPGAMPPRPVAPAAPASAVQPHAIPAGGRAPFIPAPRSVTPPVPPVAQKPIAPVAPSTPTPPKPIAPQSHVAPKPAEPTEPAKPYSVDPYREPI